MKEKESKTNESIFSYFSYYFRTKKKEIVIAVLLVILSGLIDSLGIALIVPAVDILVGFSDNANVGIISYIQTGFDFFKIPYSLRYVLGITALIMLIRSILIFVQFTYVGFINANIRLELREKFIKKINKSSWTTFKSQPQSKLISVLTLEANRAGTAYINLIMFLSNLVASLVYLTFLIFVSYKITIFALSVAILITMGFSLLSRQSNKLGKSITKINIKYIDLLNNAFNLSKHIRVHGKDMAVTRDISKYHKLMMQNNKKNSLNDSILFSTYEYAFIGFLLLGLLVSTRLLDANPSSLTLMTLIFFRLFQKTKAAQQSYQGLNKVLYSHFEFYKTLDEIKNDDKKWGSAEFNQVNKYIHFKNISFKRKSQNIFTNTSVKIKSNSTTLIVGPSGWGKTTLVDLMVGLISPDEGEILFDDINLYNYNKDSFKKSIGYVDQNASMFNDTIINNLKWGNVDVSRKKIIETSKKLGMHNKIQSFTLGYNSEVGDLGSKLSGGEKQRLAIIRALIAKPKILILDEAFNQIDSNSKLPLLETIREMQANTTIIIITHTPDTLSLADKIIEVKNNKIKTLSKNTNWSKYFGAEGESRTRTP